MLPRDPATRTPRPIEQPGQQLALLDLSTFDAPECLARCGRPALRNAKRDTFATHCGGQRCTNRNRTCQWCRQPFILGTPGAGSKYCSSGCKVAGYHPNGTAVMRCAWCDKVARGITRKWSERFIWPYVCTPCLHPIRYAVRTLKAHRVPIERARQLLTDSACEICGVDLLERTKVAREGRSDLRVQLCVDHDHRCCATLTSSCGKCVRGLLCRNCNAAVGFLRDSPETASSLALYLDTWLSRRGA